MNELPEALLDLIDDLMIEVYEKIEDPSRDNDRTEHRNSALARLKAHCEENHWEFEEAAQCLNEGLDDLFFVINNDWSTARQRREADVASGSR